MLNKKSTACSENLTCPEAPETERGLVRKQSTLGDLPLKYRRRETIFKSQWTNDDFTFELAAVIKKENTNFNYKLGLNIAMIACLFLVQLLRGSG